MLYKEKEKGYSLLEISVAVGIMTILLTVGVPAFNGAMTASQNNNAKTVLANTAIILDNEKARNNGAYPDPTPAQITRNPEMSKVFIVYGSKRLTYCLTYEIEDGDNFYLKSSDATPYRSEVNECVGASNLP